MNADVLALLRDIALVVISSSVAWFFARKKTAAETKKISAEAASGEIDASNKASNSLDEMRVENIDLIKNNFNLEKVIIEHKRTIENLTARVEARESQLEATTKQLNLLRGLAEQAPILETLRTQLEAVTRIAGNMQTAQGELQKMLVEKEKIVQDLQITNRNLEMRKSG